MTLKLTLFTKSIYSKLAKGVTLIVNEHERSDQSVFG